ncbi:MAG: TRAP transporter large permease [Deltaproteobacteria bacterium]|nr:MAG: TRAP transporter large permease [Deltaproteobacteria bacterium]
MISALIFILFVLFMMLKIPVAVAIGLATYIPFVIGGFDLISIPQQMATSTQSIPLLAIPFFLLAGVLFNNLGLTGKIFNFSRSIAGWITGGLAHTIIIAECILSGCSGTALSDAVGLGTVGIKAMKDEGYEVSFSAAVTICAAMLGPIIPPSVMMVIYAILANVSLAKLFLAGLLPGVVIAGVLMGQIYWMAKSKRITCPAPTSFSFRQVLRTLKDGVAALLAPAIIIYGMVGGIVTPTEAGILACFYSLVIGIVYRTLTLKGMKDALVETVIGTALIMYIIAISSAMGWLITMEGTPMLLADWLSAISVNKWVILTLINIFLLMLGCLMETLPAMLITVPMFLPLLQRLQVDPIHFGLIMIFNLLIGMITPPMGIGLYVMVAITGVPFEQIVKACFPFLVCLLISLALITYIPWITMVLPNLLMK